MGKLGLVHRGHAELLPKSPTDATDMDLVVQGDNGPEVLQVDRCVLLPACSVLEELCRTLPSDGCGCFRQRVILIGLNAEAVQALVKLIYRGVSHLKQDITGDVMLAASQLGFKAEILVEQVAHKEREHVVEDVDHVVCPENNEDTGNREEAELTNFHGRGEDANADQGDKGGDNLQMERVNQLSGEEREEHQGTSGQGKANPQVVCRSTEQELLGSEAQIGAQDGQLEDGCDIEREEERPDSRATSTPLAAAQAPVVYQGELGLVVSQCGGDMEGHVKPKKKRLKMTAKQSGTGDVEDVGENLESPVISEGLATLNSEAVVFGYDGSNGNISEGNVDINQEVNNEVDMEFDHSLMEKTRGSQISLGRDQLQGVNSRSRSLSPRKLMGDHGSYSKKRERMLSLGLHMKVLKKTALGIHSHESMQRSRIIDCSNSVQKKKKSGKGTPMTRDISLKRGLGSRRLLKKGDGEVEKTLNPLRECQTCKKTVTKGRGNTCTACGEVFHKKCSSRKTDGEQWLCKMCCSRQKRPSKLTPRNKKGAPGADSGQGGDKVKMNKGVAASELLMHLGCGDEENNNKEVAKKKTTLIENSAGGNGMKTLGAIQGMGNRRPARSSAKKSVGWYLEEEHESQEEPEQTRQQQFKCKDCKLGFSSSYKLRRHRKIHCRDDINTIV